MTQKQRVVKLLQDNGEVSRNYFINLPYDKITRLGAIICNLRNEGWDIDTVETNNDTIYKVKPKKVEWYKIPETGEVYKKTIWK